MLERIGRKDEEALSVLYDRYSGVVFSEVKRILHNTGAAEEILQDLFCKVWKTPERFDPAKELRRRRGYDDELNENGVALSVNVELPATQRLLVDKVRAVMKRLPGNQRGALEYAYFEGMTQAEIAKKTRQPLDTVRMWIHSAMGAVKKVLS